MLRWLLLALMAVHLILVPGARVSVAGNCVAKACGETRTHGETEGQGLIFGVHPFLPAAELNQRFSPLMKYLGARIGLPIELKIASDHAEAVELCAAAKVDLAFVGPTLYVEIIQQNPRIVPLGTVRGAYPRLRGVVVVREDSPIAKIEDLKSSRMAFVAPETTAGFQVALHVLAESGVHPQDLAGYSFLGNHANVGYAVLAGRFEAGAMKYEIFKKLQSQGLRVLAYMPEVVDQTFLATERLEPQLAEKVKSILLRMDTCPEGIKVLAQLRADFTGIYPVVDADFDALRLYIDYAQRFLRDNYEQQNP